MEVMSGAAISNIAVLSISDPVAPVDCDSTKEQEREEREEWCEVRGAIGVDRSGSK